MTTTRIAIVLGMLCATASAQPAKPAPTSPADVAYQEGRRLYDLREFADAIVKFKEAYRLRVDAASLFNIAQSYRLLGDCPQAYGYYKTFQRNYPTERADVVAKFLTELEPCSKAAPIPTPEKPTPTPTPTPEPVPHTPPVPPHPVEPPRRGGGALRISGAVVGGLGVGAIAAGVVFGLRARSQSSDLDNSDTWDPSLEDSAKRADRNAKIFLGVGGAALVGGAVLFYLGVRASAERSQVALVPSTDGATVVWSGGF